MLQERFNMTLDHTAKMMQNLNGAQGMTARRHDMVNKILVLKF
jgi:hypothetical protein